MKKLVWLTGAALCCAAALGAADFTNDGLAGGLADAYFKPAKNILVEPSRLTLPAGSLHAVTTLPWKAGALERIVLSFRARVDGPHVIEDNPQYKALFFKGEWAKGHAGQPLASWRVRCLDAAGKEVRQAANFDQFFTTLMRRDLREYREEFITLPGTESVEVVFKNANKEDTVVIENLKFTKIEKPATLNVNPEFAYGRENFSGWNTGKNYDVVENPEEPGKYMLQVGNEGLDGSIRGDWVPVTPGQMLRLEYKCRKTPGVKNNARMVIFTYKNHLLRDDCQTGSLTKNFFFGSKTSEGHYTFVVPEGIHILRVYADNVTFDYLRFVPENPEKQ